MRYAIVSDIHANLRAWEAVLADLRAQSVDVIVCLGDVVGYGPKPAEVLDAVRAETDFFVMGNHDAAAAGLVDLSVFNDQARVGIEWTRLVLKPEAKKFLSSIPLAIDTGDLLFVHAEPSEPGRFGYIRGLKEAAENFVAGSHFVTFVGHTHIPKVFELLPTGMVQEKLVYDKPLNPAHRYIVNVGSVGEPRRHEDLRAHYVIYDSTNLSVFFRQVEFDIVGYRSDLEATNLSLRSFFLRSYEWAVEGRQVSVSNGGTLNDMNVAPGSAPLVDMSRVAPVLSIRDTSQMAQQEKKKSSLRGKLMFGLLSLVVVGLLGWFFLPKGGGDEGAASKNIVGVEEGKGELIGINIVGFGSEDLYQDQSAKDLVILGEDQEAGAPKWRMKNWENIISPDIFRTKLGPITVNGDRGSRVFFQLKNHRNFGAYHWEALRNDLDSVDIGNASLLDGHSNATEMGEADGSGDPFPAKAGLMEISGISFDRYDVVIYFGGQHRALAQLRGVVRINEEIPKNLGQIEGGTRFALPMGEPTGLMDEIRYDGDQGNYIVYRGLSGSTLTIQNWGEGFFHVGVAGIQIRDTSIASGK